MGWIAKTKGVDKNIIHENNRCFKRDFTEPPKYNDLALKTGLLTSDHAIL
jgi:hypothetical protein